MKTSQWDSLNKRFLFSIVVTFIGLVTFIIFQKYSLGLAFMFFMYIFWKLIITPPRLERNVPELSKCVSLTVKTNWNMRKWFISALIVVVGTLLSQVSTDQLPFFSVSIVVFTTQLGDYLFLRSLTLSFHYKICLEENIGLSDSISTSVNRER